MDNYRAFVQVSVSGNVKERDHKSIHWYPAQRDIIDLNSIPFIYSMCNVNNLSNPPDLCF